MKWPHFIFQAVKWGILGTDTVKAIKMEGSKLVRKNKTEMSELDSKYTNE